MKKAIRILPTVVILLISTLIVLHADLSMRAQYTRFEEFMFTGIEFNVEDFSSKDVKMDDIFDIANKNNIILYKEIYDEESQENQLLFSSDDVLSLYEDRFEVIQIDSEIQDGFISTYESQREGQKYYIADLLANDRYSFYNRDSFESEDVYEWGTYSLLYKDEKDLTNFTKQIREDYDIVDNIILEFWGTLSDKTDIVIALSLLGIVIFSISFLFIVVFLLFRQSKKIGCLQLLGFSKRAIFKDIIKEYMYYPLFTAVFCLFIAKFFIENSSSRLLMSITLANVLIMLITMFLSYLGVVFITKFNNTSNIIKNESLVSKVAEGVQIFKMLVVSILLLFVIAVLPEVSETYTLRQQSKNNKMISEYAVFPKFKVDNSEYNRPENILKFYKMLEKSDVDYLYADFRDYTQDDQDYIKYYEEAEKNGVSYRIATVDRNYLKTYDLSYYDLEDNPIKLNNMSRNEEVYLIPREKENLLKDFANHITEFQNQRGIQNELYIYTYDDYVFDTYNIESAIYKIKSPILRVINSDLELTYNESSRGLDVLGTGMSTALKFDVSKGKKEVYSDLEKLIQEANLSEVIPEENLISYSDYLVDQNVRLYKTGLLLLLGSVLIYSIYLFVVFQTFTLYIESDIMKVLVKKLMGFKRKDIFKDLIILNTVTSILPILLTAIISLLYFNFQLKHVFFASIVFLLMDVFVMMFTIRMVNLDAVYEKLKGG